MKFLPSLFDLSFFSFDFIPLNVTSCIMTTLWVRPSLQPTSSRAHTSQLATRDKKPPCKKVRVLLPHRINEQSLDGDFQRGDQPELTGSVVTVPRAVHLFFHLHCQPAERLRQSSANQRGGARSHLLSAVMDIRDRFGGQTGRLTNEFPISSCYYSSIDGPKEKIVFFMLTCF